MRTFVVISVTIFFFLFLPLQVQAAMFQVNISNNGFDPVDLTIIESDTVIFTNTDSQNHWPASDPHPTHHFYGEFDPRSPILPGQSWQFSPNKAGVFRYHDHLSPHVKGIIRVTESSASSISTSNSHKSEQNSQKNIFSRIINFPGLKARGFLGTSLDELCLLSSGKVCTRSLPSPPSLIGRGSDKASIENVGRTISNMISVLQHNFPFYKKPQVTETPFRSLSQSDQFVSLDALFKQKGSQATWQFLKTTFEKDAGFSDNIHDLAHYVGGKIYESDGFRGLSICTPEFAFGCYHGFLDAAFRNDLGVLPQAVAGCARLGNTGPYASCIHGIGHGVASFYQVSDLSSALHTCENITNGAQFCFDGVFMEFSRNASKLFYKASDYLYPCNTLNQQYMAACGRNQPSVLMGRFQLPYEEVAKICMTSDSEDFRSSCIDAVGFLTASRSFGNADNIIRDCKLITDETYQARCAQKAAGELIFQNHPNWKQASFAVCDQLEKDDQNNCTTYLQTLIKEYNRN